MYMMPTILRQSDTRSHSICKFFPFFYFVFDFTTGLQNKKYNQRVLSKMIVLPYKIERKNKNSYERNGQIYFSVDYDRNIIPHNMCQLCTLSAN